MAHQSPSDQSSYNVSPPFAAEALKACVEASHSCSQVAVNALNRQKYIAPQIIVEWAFLILFSAQSDDVSLLDFSKLPLLQR